jgi:magnesium chelatase subunit D
VPAKAAPPTPARRKGDGVDDVTTPPQSEQESDDTSNRDPAPDRVFSSGQPFAAGQILPPVAGRRSPQPGRGRRSTASATGQAGHFIRATTPRDNVRDIAIAATLRAAALRQAVQGGGGTKGPLAKEQPSPGATHSTASLRISPADLRVKVRRARTGNLILFVVDASGSMGARKRMVAVKGAILSLLLDAYQKRDRVGLITFRGRRAEILVPPTNSVELAERCLRRMPTGGRTPLAAGLELAHQTLYTHLQRDSSLTPLLVLVTDGRANVGRSSQLQQAAISLAQAEVKTLVLDSEQGFVRLGAAREIAAWLGAEYLLLDDMRSEAISRRVRGTLYS